MKSSKSVFRSRLSGINRRRPCKLLNRNAKNLKVSLLTLSLCAEYTDIAPSFFAATANEIDSTKLKRRKDWVKVKQ